MAPGAKKCFRSNVMGKSRKFSKCNATGFAPDFQHDVDTLDESEGFGNSGKINTELIGSKGSCAPNKKKCFSLNVNDFDSEERSRVLSICKMSPSARMELKMRLERYLYIVSEVEKEVDGINSHPAVLSPQIDIRSCTEGQKRPPLKSQHSTLEASVTHSRKRPPPDQNGPKAKRSMSGQVESMKPAVGVTPSYAALMKQCESLLGRLMSHKYGKVFDKPVDVVKWKIPDYFTIIKHPMDLGTVKSRLISGQYPSLMDFAADVRLTFSNAMTYNPATSCVYGMADTLSKYFEYRWKPVERKILAVDCVVIPSETSKPTACVETEIANLVPPMKKKKIMPKETIVKPEPNKRFMTIEEKRRLSADLEADLKASAAELPGTIIDFLRGQSYHAAVKIVGDEIEVELDINALKDDKLFELRKLLEDHSSEKRKMHTMDEPCKEPVDHDEDVDIVGGVDPLPSYPPVVIEIDSTNRNKNCSSSSSSSSESGSSSSDSDSSPESDSDISNASEPLNTIKEIQGCDTLDARKGGVVNSETGMDSLNAVGQVQQSSHTYPVIDEPQSHQEGKNAPSKSQVSPKKLHRVALLRRRFANTILKAEKALEKMQDPNKLRMERKEPERQQKEVKASMNAVGQFEPSSQTYPVIDEPQSHQEGKNAPSKSQVSPEKLCRADLLRHRFADTILKAEKALEKDPNKLRMERKEPKRQQKEVKAQLQAEAKVASRRKVEAAVSVEAKRKREPEREAARQALQKMEKTEDFSGSSQFMEELEKTVDTNGSSQFMEDLEMLSCVQGVQLPSFAEVASAYCPQNGFGSFKLHGSNNILEKLGLFLKVDDEDEEEESPQIETGQLMI